MEISLGNLRVGQKGEIVGFSNLKSVFRRKLIVMGLNRGEKVSVERLAPLGDPMEIKVRGYSLTLRKSEANVLQVKVA